MSMPPEAVRICSSTLATVPAFMRTVARSAHSAYLATSCSGLCCSNRSGDILRLEAGTHRARPGGSSRTGTTRLHGMCSVSTFLCPARAAGGGRRSSDCFTPNGAAAAPPRMPPIMLGSRRILPVGHCPWTQFTCSHPGGPQCPRPTESHFPARRSGWRR